MATQLTDTGLVLGNNTIISSATPRIKVNGTEILTVVGRTIWSSATATSFTTLNTWQDSLTLGTYTRKKANSNIFYIAKISNSFAFTNTGINHATVSCRLKFVNAVGTNYSTTHNAWARYDYGQAGAGIVEHEETVSFFNDSATSTWFGAEGSVTTISLQAYGTQSSGVLSRFGINLWGAGSSFELIEFI